MHKGMNGVKFPLMRKATFYAKVLRDNATGFQQQALSTTIPRHSCGVSPVALGVQHNGHHPV